MSNASNPLESIELRASRRKVLELAESLAKAHGKIAGLEDRWASARQLIHDLEDRLREEIANAEQAEERVAQTAAYSANAIEANEELAQRVTVLEGFLVLCGRHLDALNQPHWVKEVDRVLGEEKA